MRDFFALIGFVILLSTFLVSVSLLIGVGVDNIKSAIKWYKTRHAQNVEGALTLRKEPLAECRCKECFLYNPITESCIKRRTLYTAENTEVRT